MNTRKAWTIYIVWRLVFIAVPFAALMLIGWPWWLAAITATLVAVSLSVVLLSKPREIAAESVYDWRHRGHTADNVAEDAEIGEANLDTGAEVGEADVTTGAEVSDAAITTEVNESEPTADPAAEPPVAPGGPAEPTEPTER